MFSDEPDADVKRKRATFDQRIRHNFRRLRLARAAIPLGIERAGGLVPVLKKGFSILKREGVPGLKFRLLNLVRQLQKKHPRLGTAQIKNVAIAGIEFDRNYRYRLVGHDVPYTYILPGKPYNLDVVLSGMKALPKFSILVPVYNTPPDLLDYLLRSVKSQWYPYWELILANDASSTPETIVALARIEDPRITILNLQNNSGIAGATNAALDAATGEYVVLLDHDDELTEDCLFELALCIEREAPEYIYSDEDKIDSDGRYTEPHFKPDWSPDTMMSTMFVCHVSCIKLSLLKQMGGLRPDFDGCQDWDMVLRLSELTNRISHIPKVLYHWRIIPASTASDIAAKPYVMDASRRVREDALQRRGLRGTVEPLQSNPGYFRTNYKVSGSPAVSIIIPTRDNKKMLERCIASILDKTRYSHFEIIVMDNGSVEPDILEYLQKLKQNERIKIVRHDYPFNFSELNNVGARHARGEFLLFLNDDTEVLHDEWLERLTGYAQLSHVGAVGAKLCYPDAQIVQHAGIVNLQDGPAHAFTGQPVNAACYYMRNLLEYNWLAVTGACLMVNAKKFEMVGGFDESMPVAYNDVDLCLRLVDAGLYNIVCQAVTLIHHESVSRGMDDTSHQKHSRLQREKHALFQKHPKYFQFDPFHSPNLHPNSANFDIVG